MSRRGFTSLARARNGTGLQPCTTPPERRGTGLNVIEADAEALAVVTYARDGTQFEQIGRPHVYPASTVPAGTHTVIELGWMFRVGRKASTLRRPSVGAGTRARRMLGRARGAYDRAAAEPNRAFVR